jgi:DNA polymerase I-like protein with 3'-5' exonuclease and polymerase domains
MQTVTTTGKLTLPTGREYYFKPYHNHYKGLQWPRTKILNYPVQGLGAELVALIRVLVRRRLMNEDPSTLMISSVHDSVVLDSLRKFLYNNMVMLKDCVESTPVFFKNTFGTAFDIPLMCEIQYGPNKYNMEEWNGETP